ncbi:Protein of unknown function (DUF3027) [Williamsia deligens]|nr:Protein of unknown function (DUF3027) [Williamsia deligens]
MTDTPVTDTDAPASADVPTVEDTARDAAPEIAVDPEIRARLEERLTAAVDAARDAAVAVGEASVGDHLDAVVEGECSVTHYFAADLPGYRGWVWCAVLATCPGETDAVEDAVITVSEVALLPGAEALTAPEWIPWSERIVAGDLGPGDVLAAPADDPRLVPNHLDVAELESTGLLDEATDVHLALGLGRRRVLSREGRDDAADRWWSGERGPDSEMASSTRMSCGTCGFYLPLAGALRVAFGVCANQYAADGQVVAAEYGCGAHSDAVAPSGEGSPAYDAYDDGAIEVVASAPSDTARADSPSANPA